MSMSHAIYGAVRSVFSPVASLGRKICGRYFIIRIPSGISYHCSVVLWKGPLHPERHERVEKVVWHKKPVTIPTICEANRA